MRREQSRWRGRGPYPSRSLGRRGGNGFSDFPCRQRLVPRERLELSLHGSQALLRFRGCVLQVLLFRLGAIASRWTLRRPIGGARGTWHPGCGSFPGKFWQLGRGFPRRRALPVVPSLIPEGLLRCLGSRVSLGGSVPGGARSPLPVSTSW